MQAVIDDALQRIKGAGKATGIMSLDPPTAKAYLDRGVDFVAVAVDAMTLAMALRSTAAACR
mgnify:CR=1 FL=1